MEKLITVIILHFFLFGDCNAQKARFKNPILDDLTKFESVFKHDDGSYYMVLLIDDDFVLLQSSILSDFRDAQRQPIYRKPPNASNLGSARIHFIQGNLYIYFHMNYEGSYHTHVIKSLDRCSPLGDWSNSTELLPQDDTPHMMMGTVLQYTNGELYFVWAGSDAGAVNLFIARMETPTKIAGPKILLRSPTQDWERKMQIVNEGPSILQHKGSTFLIFSASGSGSPDYCLGIMGIDGGKDPMLVSNWWNDVNHCVFARNDTEEVWSTGHASFVLSPDNSETWMAYHAWSGRQGPKTFRIQKVDWMEMNRPKFPIAMGLDRYLDVPSGE